MQPSIIIKIIVPPCNIMPRYGWNVLGSNSKAQYKMVTKTFAGSMAAYNAHMTLSQMLSVGGGRQANTTEATKDINEYATVSTRVQCVRNANQKEGNLLPEMLIAITLIIHTKMISLAAIYGTCGFGENVLAISVRASLPSWEPCCSIRSK